MHSAHSLSCVAAARSPDKERMCPVTISWLGQAAAARSRDRGAGMPTRRGQRLFNCMPIPRQSLCRLRCACLLPLFPNPPPLVGLPLSPTPSLAWIHSLRCVEAHAVCPHVARPSLSPPLLTPLIHSFQQDNPLSQQLLCLLGYTRPFRRVKAHAICLQPRLLGLIPCVQSPHPLNSSLALKELKRSSQREGRLCLTNSFACSDTLAHSGASSRTRSARMLARMAASFASPSGSKG